MQDQSFSILQAYSYHGETLLAEEKCGEAIRGLQEGIAGTTCHQLTWAQLSKALLA